MSLSLPKHFLDHLATTQNLDGLQIIGSIQGQRHEVVQLQDKSGRFYALRRFMPKDADVNYFNLDFCMSRECLAIQSLNTNSIAAPHLLAHQVHHDFGHYALLSWLEGDHLNAHFKAACESGDEEVLIQLSKMIGRLFADIHSSPIPDDIEFQKHIHKSDSLGIYINAIREHAHRDDFRAIYTGDVDVLLSAATDMYVKVANSPPPTLIIYDLHGENMIVHNDNIFVFDVDYAHIGVSTAEFIPIFHDLFARFLPQGHSLQGSLREAVLSSYAQHGGVFYPDCEMVLALNHFMISMIKLLYRKESEAKSKISIYDQAIRKIVEKHRLDYPKVGWAGDPEFGSAQQT